MALIDVILCTSANDTMNNINNSALYVIPTLYSVYARERLKIGNSVLYVRVNQCYKLYWNGAGKSAESAWESMVKCALSVIIHNFDDDDDDDDDVVLTHHCL